MEKQKKVLGTLALALLLSAALFAVYRLTHPTRWAKDLLTYLGQAETVTGEAVWLHPAAQSVPLSPEQTERVLAAVRGARAVDNRGFAGTTESAVIVLTVDGRRVSAGFLEDTELQYTWNGEKRSVRMAREGYAPVLQEIMQEAFPDFTIRSASFQDFEQ